MSTKNEKSTHGQFSIPRWQLSLFGRELFSRFYPILDPLKSGLKAVSLSAVDP